MTLSIIIPTLNEADEIKSLLESLSPMKDAGARIIVADGGSEDDTVAAVGDLAELVRAPRGRGRQMNAGAMSAGGDWLLFLHADTRLPADAAAIIEAVRRTADAQWGFFPVRLSGQISLLRLVEKGMNWRSRLSRVATGDQAIFIRRSLFDRLGGFANIPIMEDVEICKRLRRHARPVIPNRPVVTSSRRWEAQGVLRTVITMWALRMAYSCGVKPAWLVKRYYRNPAL